ncbi:hypothetical protein R8510_04394 [Ralstonia chuxiongensis]|nr:hypothetical protein R8510_04394 [Ralstonia chuxiongensis]
MIHKTTNSLAFSLYEGERYAGIATDDTGRESHHIVLLPVQADGMNLDQAWDWAEYNGGVLPTLVEWSALEETLRDEFSANNYWTGNLESAGANCMYVKIFNSLTSTYGRAMRDSKHHARAIRRVDLSGVPMD